MRSALDAVTLVGHSFGAMAAAEYAAHYPRRVRKLVLVSPLGLWRDEQPLPDMFDVLYTAIDTVLWKSGKASPEMSDPGDEPNDPLEKQVSDLTGVDHGREIHLAAAGSPPAPPAAAHHRRDAGDPWRRRQFVPAAYADDFAAAIRGARKAIIADAAHMAPYEKPAEFFRLLDDFLAAKVRAA